MLHLRHFRHIEEYDADIFSGICIAEHIFDFICRAFKDNLNDDRLNNFIAITISGIMAHSIATTSSSFPARRATGFLL